MKFRIFIGIFAVSITCGVTCLAQTPAAPATSVDEKALWDLWKLQQEKPSDHDAMSTACMDLVKKAPKDRLSIVPMTIAAWHLLKLDKKESSIKLLRTVIALQGNDQLGMSAASISRVWLTRIDMDQVKQALQLCYYKKIEYPKTLDAIKPFQKEGQPPLVDRWEKPWVYGLTESKYAKKAGISTYGQFYTLRSSILGTNSELKAALKIPYAAGLPLKPVKLLSGSLGREMVQFETTDGKAAKVVLTSGIENNGFIICYAGPKLLILSDLNHLTILPRPN